MGFFVYAPLNKDCLFRPSGSETIENFTRTKATNNCMKFPIIKKIRLTDGQTRGRRTDRQNKTMQTKQIVSNKATQHDRTQLESI
jgi:hypothetical protein